MANSSDMVSRLRELGVAAENHPSKRLAATGLREWTLSRGDSSRTYIVVSGTTTKLSVAVAGQLIDRQLPLLVWDDQISAEMGSVLRRAGVQYADLAGNAWLEFGNVLIDISGREHSHSRDGKAKATRDPDANRGSNPFSANRNQVVFALLAWPDLWDASNRTLARVAGVSVGLAHDTTTMLKDSGLAARSTRFKPGGLIDQWARAFNHVTGPRLQQWEFYGDIDVNHLRGALPVYVSGESAARNLIKPGELLVYTRDLRPDDDRPPLPILNRWRRNAPTEHMSPNIIVRQQFWTPPTDDRDESEGLVREAPWPLVYADLLASHDPRVQETAQEWRLRHV